MNESMFDERTVFSLSGPGLFSPRVSLMSSWSFSCCFRFAACIIIVQRSIIAVFVPIVSLHVSLLNIFKNSYVTINYTAITRVVYGSSTRMITLYKRLLTLPHYGRVFRISFREVAAEGLEKSFIRELKVHDTRCVFQGFCKKKKQCIFYCRCRSNLT